MNFEAIAGRVSPDDVIALIVAEMCKRYDLRSENEIAFRPEADNASVPDISDGSVVDDNVQSETVKADKKSKRRFSKK